MNPAKVVLSYVNPDTDGVCCAIGYSALHTDFEPIYLGALDNETRFVLDLFGIKEPRKVERVDAEAIIALVDTHHLAQLPKELNPQNVVEIVDHHPAGDIAAFPNARIQNEPVGAACTLIAEKLRQYTENVSASIAGILSLGIVSNTINFTAPSTSERDTAVFRWLSDRVTIDDALIMRMFKAKSDIEGISTLTLLESALKVFKFSERSLGISQVEVADTDSLILRTELVKSLEAMRIVKGLDYCILSAINIMDHTTTLVPSNRESAVIVQNALGVTFLDGLCRVDRIILRKTDLVPKIARVLSENR